MCMCLKEADISIMVICHTSAIMKYDRMTLELSNKALYIRHHQYRKKALES